MKIYINEDKLSLLAEGKDRKQQARAKTKKVIINYFNDSPMLYEPNEETNGMNLLDFLEQEVMHDFFHSRSRSDAKGYFICLEPMVANIILHAGWQQDRHDNGVIARLQAILNYVETLYTQGKIDPRSISLDSTIEQLNQEFGSVIDQLNSEEEARMNNASYIVNEDYEILDDVSYEQAHEIGNYSYSNQPLCYTQSEGTWQNSFDGKKNKVYALLKKGWKNVAEEHGESLLSQYPDANAYDEYGLSMIFLFVSPDDELVYSNTRWNHEADYGNGRSVDHAFTKEDISNLVGYNFNQRFVGYTEEELSSKGIKYVSFKKVPKLLAQGVRWVDIFDMVYDFEEGFAKVSLNDKYNFLTQDGNLLSPNQWFDRCGDFHNGLVRILINGKHNYLTQDGTLLSPNQWFDGCSVFKEGFSRVHINEKYNYLTTNGTLLWNKPIEEWFDGCGDFYKGLGWIRLNSKFNYLTTNGTLLWNKPIEEWFDGGGNFSKGLGWIRLDRKFNYLTQDGTLLWNKPIEEWFDNCSNFDEGFGMVRLNNKYNYLTQDGTLLWNKPIEEWFDRCEDWCEGLNAVRLNHKYNFLTQDGNLLSPNQWFDDCMDFREGFGIVRLNNKYNFLTQDGTLLWNKPIEEWFDRCGNFSKGLVWIRLNDKYNYLTQDGTLLWNKPIEEWFDWCGMLQNGMINVYINGQDYYLTTDGVLLDYQTKEPIQSPSLSMSENKTVKKIYINECKLSLLKESQEEVTFYGFFTQVKNFMKELLNGNVTAEPSQELKKHGLGRKELISKLKKKGLLTSDENIDEVPNEDDETKLRARHTITYSVPKRDFEKKFHRLYSELFESEWKPKPVLSNEKEEIQKILDNDIDGAYKNRGGYKIQENSENEISSKFIQDRLANTFERNQDGYMWDGEKYVDIPKDTRIKKYRQVAVDKLSQEKPHSGINTGLYHCDDEKWLDLNKNEEIFFIDDEYQSLEDLYNGVQSGDLLIHCRKMESNIPEDIIYPEVGDTVKDAYGCEMGEEDFTPLIYASDDFTWADMKQDSPYTSSRNGIYFIKSDNFMRYLGDNYVQEPNGRISRNDIPTVTIESGDWFSEEPAEVVGVVRKKLPSE